MKNKKKFSSLPHSSKFFTCLSQDAASSRPSTSAPVPSTEPSQPSAGKHSKVTLPTKEAAIQLLNNQEKGAYIIRQVDEREGDVRFAATVVTSKRPKKVDCIKNKRKAYMWHLTSENITLQSQEQFESYIDEVLTAHDKEQLNRAKSGEDFRPNKCPLS